MNAVSMSVAEKYIAAFSNLAKEGNTVLLPSNTGDVSSMVTQVLKYFVEFTEHVKYDYTSYFCFCKI